MTQLSFWDVEVMVIQLIIIILMRLQDISSHDRSEKLFQEKQCFSYHNQVVSEPKPDQIISTALSRDKIEN